MDQGKPLVLVLGHPLAPSAKDDLGEMLGGVEFDVIDLPSSYDLDQPLAPQVRKQFESETLTSDEWQARPLFLVPPSLAVACPVVLAEIHGLRGDFPALVRQVRDPGVLGTWRVAEIIDLSAIRQESRKLR